MHKASKLLAILFAAVLFLNSIGVAEASTSKPTKVWDWTKGAYSFEGTASMENLYTNYRFTNMSVATIKVTNTSSKGSVKVKLRAIGPWYLGDKTVSTVTVPKDGTTTWTVRDLDPDKQYYIIFEAPCYFKGNISRP